MRKKFSFAEIWLVLAAIAVACLVAEIGIRLSPVAKSQFITYDNARGWKLRAGASGWQLDEGRAWVRINRWGYRGPDWPLKKAPGDYRIAVIGDSFTEAQQVEENRTFCAVVQRALTANCTGLHQRHVKQVEVLNFGVDGYGTSQELITLMRDARRFAPDFVVLGFFAGNDIRNNSVILEGDKCRPFYVYQGGRLVLGGPFYDSDVYRFQCFGRFESRHSQLLNLLGSVRSRLRMRIRRWEAGPVHVSHARILGMHEAGLNDEIYGPPATDVWRDAWRVTEAEIEMIHQETIKENAGFLVAALSTGVQDYPSPQFRASYLKSATDGSILYPDMELARFAAQHGFEVLSVGAAMGPYADEHHVFFHGFPNTKMGTGHWNEAGHQFAGQLIASEICKMVAASRTSNSAVAAFR